MLLVTALVAAQAVDEAAADPNTAVKVALITMFGGVVVALIGLAGLIVQTHAVGRKVAGVGETVESVKAEVSRNGGKSTKDQVVAAAGSVRKIERRLDAGGRRMDSIESDVADVKNELAAVRAGVGLLLSAAGIDPDDIHSDDTAAQEASP